MEQLNDVKDLNLQNTDDEEEFGSQPLQPESMYFAPSEYTKSCKIGSRCVVGDTVTKISEFSEELRWFTNHSQFKHIFHMHKEANHMNQGFWMLLLRTAQTEMERECWFVVNGVPIRYSMREHALLSGLACHEYPRNWRQLGNLKFAEKVFGKTKGVHIREVEEKLDKMKHKSTAVRKKLVILYFLFKVVKAKTKGDGIVDPWLLRVVTDLDACESFPWGRYTFDECLEGIKSVMNKMKGQVKPGAQTSFPSFIVPLEVMQHEF